MQIQGLVHIILEKGCMCHYMSMADRNRRSYLEKDQIRLKRYFYMLRPVLACMWIQKGRACLGSSLRSSWMQNCPRSFEEAIDQLLLRKQAAVESDEGPVIPNISDFIRTR